MELLKLNNYIGTEPELKDSLTGLFNHGFFLVYLEQEALRFKTIRQSVFPCHGRY